MLGLIFAHFYPFSPFAAILPIRFAMNAASKKKSCDSGHESYRVAIKYYLFSL